MRGPVFFDFVLYLFNSCTVINLFGIDLDGGDRRPISGVLLLWPRLNLEGKVNSISVVFASFHFESLLRIAQVKFGLGSLPAKRLNRILFRV